MSPFFKKDKNEQKVFDESLYVSLPATYMLKRSEDEQISDEDAKKSETFVEEGKKYVYPERYELWKFLTSVISPLQYSVIEEALNEMKNIEELGAFEATKKVDDAGLLCLEIVLNFSKKGPEFFEYFKGILKKYKIVNRDSSYITGKGLEKQVANNVNKLKELNDHLAQKQPATESGKTLK